MKIIEHDLRGLTIQEKIRFLDTLNGEVKYASNGSWNSVSYYEIADTWLVSDSIVEGHNDDERSYWTSSYSDKKYKYVNK